MHFQEDLKQSSQSGFSLINCYIYRYLIEPPVRYVVQEGDALMNLIQNCEHWHADIPLLNVRHDMLKFLNLVNWYVQVDLVAMVVPEQSKR